MSNKHDETVRWCKRCEQLKLKERFLAWSTRGGAVQHRGHCLDCRQTYAEERTLELVEYRQQYNAGKRSLKRTRDRQRREEVKAAIAKLKDAPCLDCGNRFPPVAMDFDHLGGKTKSIAEMAGQAYKLDLILEEIKRCELVCACCHRIRTEKRKQNLARVYTVQLSMKKQTSDLSEDILSLFSDSSSSLSVALVREKLGARYGAVSKLLRRLVVAGKLVNVGRGVYRLSNDERGDFTPSNIIVEDSALTDRALSSMTVSNRILALFALNPTAILSTADIVSRVGYGAKRDTMVTLICRLCEEGHLIRTDRSFYRLPTQEEILRAQEAA